MKVLRFALVLFLGLFTSNILHAQIIKDPTTWTFETKKVSSDQYDLIFHLKLKDEWHIYSFNPGGDGMELPPAFTFDSSTHIHLLGKTEEHGKMLSEKFEGIDGMVNIFKDTVVYVQHIKVDGDTKVTGQYEYQVCNDEMCLPPKTKQFSFVIGSGGSNNTAQTTATATNNKDNGTTASNASSNTSNQSSANGPDKKSLLWLFFEALIGGILAVLTPCVYSMIPITVSFFTKRSKTRAEGIRNAFYYSLSIVLIFTILGVVISAVFGSNALNNLSTNWIANLFFFAVFVVFGISFLGAFEITLPSSWTSKTDSRAGIGSFGGIFFMALTLVIVSFSCTGPIVGPLLVLAGRGGIVGPALGMFGFAVGLSLPFALFAVFPGLLNKMANSGGWLNQVKVTLGFIELMLAMKFLSNADLARGWRLLDREIFIAVWIVLAVLLGLYLLGKLKLSHDDQNPKNMYGQEYVSIFKLFLAIACFSFSVYLVPGLWGAPLNGMSQFIPPMGTQDFILNGNPNSGGQEGDGSVSASDNPNIKVRPVKYVDEMKIYEPPVAKTAGLVTFYDYDEALAAAKKLHKPVMLDFTGINCVNCRKMEAQVWSDPEVMKLLKNDFIIASLYCDYDKRELPKDQQYFSKALDSKVVTVGDKNEDIQASKFNSNSQPFYFYVDENGTKLVDGGYSYDPDIQKFVHHLQTVITNYKKLHPGS